MLAEFRDPDPLIAAMQKTHEAGYRRIDAFTPYPIEALADALHFKGTSVPLVVLAGGIFGGIVGYGMQYYVSAIAYPLNVGGRPINSWPLFVPVSFEMIVLFAALAGAIGMFVLNGLPMPYHPVFNIARFSDASKDGFFLIIEAADPKFDYEVTRTFLKSLNPHEVYDVPA